MVQDLPPQVQLLEKDFTMIFAKDSVRQKQILIKDCLANSAADVDYFTCGSNLPVPIEDSDLSFDGKPLSSHFEEDRREASQASQSVRITNRIDSIG
jgi:hypothetical protein